VDRTENLAVAAAGAVMALFFGALVYAATALDIDVPTCITDMAPFSEGKVIDEGGNRYEVHMVAKMWAFDPPEVRLPPGSQVDLYLSSADVTHGLYIEHTNVNLMAVPGSVNAASFRLDHEGEYDVVCHEYCGLAHHRMMGKIVVAAGAAPAAAATTAHAEAAEGEAEGASEGAALYESKGCDTCHTTDGSEGIGPTFKGLFGSERHFTDGSTRKADEAYLAQSMRDPNALVVDGFDPMMPEEPLTDEEVEELVEYIESLS